MCVAEKALNQLLSFTLPAEEKIAAGLVDGLRAEERLHLQLSQAHLAVPKHGCDQLLKLVRVCLDVLDPLKLLGKPG
jgi:hypothetical protein